MKLEEQNILFFSRSTQHGGTENVILQLCEIFNPLVNKIVVVSADGFAVDKLNSLGIKHYMIPDIENKSPLVLLEVIKRLKNVVLEENITVIHTHHRMAAFYVRLTGLYKYCRFINTSHNTFSNRKALTRFAYNKAHLIACGEMVKKNLTDVFGLKDVTVIHNAVKPFNEDIVMDKELQKAREDGKFLVGNIGRLSEQKGMEYYIQSVSDVHTSHPDTQFYIIGSGEDEEKLKKMAEGLPISFLGYRTDVQNLMSQLDLIVLSSLWEGLPLTPIEAFSVGKTIVATGVDGTLEIVKDGENGLVVEPRNSKAIAESVSWIIEHPEKKMNMEKKARISFEQNYSIEKLAEQYIKYYKRSMNSNSV